MGERTVTADVVVVGAGTAGTQAAVQLARSGLDVVLVDKRPEGRGGARWCNGVVPWQFERAGLEPPSGAEKRGAEGPSHMISPTRKHRFVIPESPIWEADMRLLGERLWALADHAGVTTHWGVGDLTVRLDGDRPVELTGTQGADQVRLSAALFVDGSGRRGVLRDQVPTLARHCPPAAPQDLCSAQHLILEIQSPGEAMRWLESVDAQPGEAVTWLSPVGGFSTQVIKVEPSLEEVSVLVGCLADGNHGTAGEMMKQVRAEHTWIGRPVFGGGALIPLHRVYDRLAVPGLALVGDAAGQVMAGHGSGIGYGLIGGKVLADAVADTAGSDPGSLDAMWRYQARYLREFGGTLAAYDVFRRMSVTLGAEGVEEMFATGIFGPDMVEPGLFQKLGTPRLPVVAAQAKALATHRGLGRVVAPALARAGAAQAVYRAYPTKPGERALTTWSRTAKALTG